VRVKIRNLRHTTTVADLERLLAPFSASEIYLDRSDGNPAHGFAYASVADARATEVIAALDGVEFLGRRIEVVPARSRRWASA